MQKIFIKKLPFLTVIFLSAFFVLQVVRTFHDRQPAAPVVIIDDDVTTAKDAASDVKVKLSADLDAPGDTPFERLKIFCQENKDRGEAACQSQYDPALIDWIKRYWLKHPHDPTKPLNFEREPVLRGQVGVPVYVDQILHNKTGGFYIEVGAFDGEYLTNTILFELQRKWSGLLIEPNPSVFKRLNSKNRRATLLNSCLSTSPKPENITFIHNEEMGGRKDLLPWGFQSKPSSTAVCFPIFSVLEALGNPTIDYFSLDVEGSEYGVLKSIPWEKVNIKVWSIEYNPMVGPWLMSKRRIIKFMQSKGYELKKQIDQDLIFAIKGLSKKG